MEDSLSKKVIKGGAWIFSLRMVEKSFGLIRLVVLARLLAPTDFGMIGIALIGMSVLETFSQTGFQMALVHKNENIKTYLDTAWTVSVIRSIILFALLVFFAKHIAVFFHSPEAALVVRIAGLSILFQGFTNIGTIHFQKELEFRKQFIFQLGSTLSDFIVSVLLALILRSFWALVFGLLAGELAKCVLSYMLHPYRPRLRLDLDKAKELFSFGKWVSISAMLGFLLSQGDGLLVGKLLGVAALGFYQMAYKISNMPATEVAHTISNVTFPAYSKMQDNLPRLREAYLRVLQLTAFLSFPIAALIFVLARDFTGIFLGEKWMSMVPAMQVLVFAGLFRSIAATSGYIFYAVGRPGTDTKWQIVRFFVFAILIYPFAVEGGITGVAVAVLLSIAVSTIGFSLSAIKVTECSAKSFGRIIIIPLINGAAVLLLISGLKMTMDGGLWSFIICACTGVAVYLAMTQLSDRFFNYMMYPAIKENFKILRGV